MAFDRGVGRLIVAGASASGQGGPTPGGRVDIVDGATGKVAQAVALKGRLSALAVDGSARRAFVFSAGYDGHGNGTGTVSVLDLAAGRMMRTVALPMAPAAATVAERSGRVFALGDAISGDVAPGNVTMLDAASGAILPLARG